jgi:hypothetical protein
MTIDAPKIPSGQWSAGQWVGAVLVWLWVLVPLGWGLYQFILRLGALFG